MIGYVHTEYGARSLDTVKDEINQYADSPLVTGIFFDEVASGTDQLAYYTNLLPNPWDSLPAYWTHLVAAVAARRSPPGAATGLTIIIK